MWQIRDNHAMFHVERGMTERRVGLQQILADVQRHARVRAQAVPVDVVVVEVAARGNLRDFGFEFLQAHDVGLVAVHPFAELGFARANAIDVPGGDFHGGILAARNGAGSRSGCLRFGVPAAGRVNIRGSVKTHISTTRRGLLAVIAVLIAVLSAAPTALAADTGERFRVFHRDRWVSYLEQDGLAIAEGDILLGDARAIARVRDAPVPLKALVIDQADSLWPAVAGVHRVPYVYEAGPQANIDSH